MDPGYRTPLIDFFRRGEAAQDAKMLAAHGALPTTAREQLALLLLLADDHDPAVASTAGATLDALPVPALRAFLAGPDVPDEMKRFFAARGIAPGDAPGDGAPLVAAADEDEPTPGEDPQLLSALPIKQKLKLASRGTREQRAQLIRDPNRMVAAAVLSSPKLTESEIEAFAKMQNVAEDVLRVIGTNRAWLKNYGVVVALVRNAKTPPAVSMQLLPRITERDVKMLAVDRNVPEALRLAARKFAVKRL